MPKRWLVYVSGTLSCLALLGGAAQSMAQATGDYATDLATLYDERYALQAQKDVCISVQPKTRAELQKAYDGWRDRHEDLLDDLDDRFAAMIKKASVDQKDYSRNFGKYQGAVMRQRQEAEGRLARAAQGRTAQTMQGIAGLPAQPEIEYSRQVPRRVQIGIREKVSRGITNSGRTKIKMQPGRNIEAMSNRWCSGHKVRA